MDSNIISKQTARRYVLGRQGLWPGRRFVGEAGTAQAIRQSEGIQVDTINIIARSHDLALWSRVVDYQPAQLNRLLYTSHQFFDYGTILLVYPIEELVHWQAVMARWQERFAEYLTTNQVTCDFVRQELTTRGPLGNRDFVARERIPGGFRTIKDTGKALYYLWLAGEIMTHSRRGFERIYDFRENVIAAARTANIEGLPTAFPTVPLHEADVKAAEDFLAFKALRDVGLATSREWARRLKIMLHRPVTPADATRWLTAPAEQGLVAQVQVEGHKLPCYLPAADLPLLNIIAAERIPAQWQPLGPTTLEQVNLLAPLDNVIWDRARTQTLFDFDYVWEVYKPLPLRKWGYYTLPILFGDKLVGRLSPKLDRKNSKMLLEGFWLEDEALAYNATFRDALRSGLQAFAAFHGVSQIEPPPELPPALKSLLAF